MTIKPLFMGFAVLALLLVGCTQKETQQLDIKGDIEVYVTAYSQWGDENNDKANFEVKLVGTNPELMALTDTSGKAVIKNVPIGTYKIVTSKDGYGTSVNYNYKFIGKQTPISYSVSAYQKSTTKFSNLTASLTKDSIKVSGKYTNELAPTDNKYLYALAFYGISAAISSSNYELGTSARLSFNTNSSGTFVSGFYFSKSSYPSKSVVYFVLYGYIGLFDPFGLYDHYYDYETDRIIYPSLGAVSEVISVVIP